MKKIKFAQPTKRPRSFCVFTQHQVRRQSLTDLSWKGSDLISSQPNQTESSGGGARQSYSQVNTTVSLWPQLGNVFSVEDEPRGTEGFRWLELNTLVKVRWLCRKLLTSSSSYRKHDTNIMDVLAWGPREFVTLAIFNLLLACLMELTSLQAYSLQDWGKKSYNK